MFKKGDLNLSINAIVVLVLAITMLMLGLMFIRNIFGGAAEQFAQVSEDVEKDMVDQLKESGKKVKLGTYEVEMKQSQEKTVFLGIKNELGDAGTRQDFGIALTMPGTPVGSANCVGAGGSDYGSIVTETVKSIQSGEAKVVPIKIKSGPRNSGTCVFTITITDGSSAWYGEEELYVTVQ